MSLKLEYIGAGELARELIGRVPTIVRRQIASGIRRRPRSRPTPAQRDEDANAVVATFERPDGPPVPLLGGYRRRIKPRWAQGFWAVKVLVHLEQAVTLPPHAIELATALAYRAHPAAIAA